MAQFEYLRKGFPLLIRYAGLLKPKVKSIQEIQINGAFNQSKEYRTFIYKPYSYYSKTPIFLMHGMSVYGVDDPRIHELAAILCSSGFDVYIPEIKEISSLIASIDTPANIADIYMSIANLTGKSPGLFLISFSGGMGLIAMGDSRLEVHPNATMIVGGYTVFKSTMVYTMENFDLDDYACWIFLYNYIDLVFPVTDNLKKLFFQKAIDNGTKNFSSQESKELENQLDVQEKQILKNISSNKEYRLELGNKLYTNGESIFYKLSPINYVNSLKGKFSILHGCSDPVLSEKESIILSEKMKSIGIEHNLELTRLLSHGDKASYAKNMIDIPGLANAFGYFMVNLG